MKVKCVWHSPSLFFRPVNLGLLGVHFCVSENEYFQPKYSFSHQKRDVFYHISFPGFHPTPSTWWVLCINMFYLLLKTNVFDNYGFMFLAYILHWHNCDLLMRNEVPTWDRCFIELCFPWWKNSQKSCSRISFLFQVLNFFYQGSRVLRYSIVLPSINYFRYNFFQIWYCIPTCVFLAIFLESCSLSNRIIRICTVIVRSQDFF